MERLRYEIVFDCRERGTGERLCTQLQDVVGDAVSDGGRPEDVLRSEDGPTTWGVTATFSGSNHADRFFRGENYRQFCVEVRRTCQAPVFVVPLGGAEG